MSSFLAEVSRPRTNDLIGYHGHTFRYTPALQTCHLVELHSDSRR
jgi:hypothetical protein